MCQLLSSATLSVPSAIHRRAPFCRVRIFRIFACGACRGAKSARRLRPRRNGGVTPENRRRYGFSRIGQKRYACRKYLDRKVEPEKLAAVLEAGRVAPTGANRQPQRLIVVESPEGMERLARCTRDFGAPAAVVVCADTSEVWTRKYDGKRIGDIDASIVTDHMMLAAASLGLDTLWICMFKPEAVREEFGLPDTVEPVNILLIGYGADAPASPDRHATLRKPLEETVFYERFGQKR